jgi:hypothetical protein
LRDPNGAVTGMLIQTSLSFPFSSNSFPGDKVEDLKYACFNPAKLGTLGAVNVAVPTDLASA